MPDIPDLSLLPFRLSWKPGNKHVAVRENINGKGLTGTGGCAILFLFGTAIVSRQRRGFSARQGVGHVVRHGRPEAGGRGGGLHGHGLLRVWLVVGRRPLGQPPRPLSAPPAARAPLRRLLGVPDVDVAVKVAEVGRRELRLMVVVMVMVGAGLVHWRRRRMYRHLRELNLYD